MSLSAEIQRPEGMSDAQWVAYLRKALALMKQNTPVKTGNLRDNWTLANLGGKGLLTNEVPYGIYVDEGNTRGLAPRNFVQGTLSQLGG
jgi:hypothetical protein